MEDLEEHYDEELEDCIESAAYLLLIGMSYTPQSAIWTEFMNYIYMRLEKDSNYGLIVTRNNAWSGKLLTIVCTYLIKNPVKLSAEQQ